MNGHTELANGREGRAVEQPAAEQNDGAQPGPTSGADTIQNDILAAGPEAAALHFKAAHLFNTWLAEEKAAEAEAALQREQQEADNVRLTSCPDRSSHTCNGFRCLMHCSFRAVQPGSMH